VGTEAQLPFADGWVKPANAIIHDAQTFEVDLRTRSEDLRGRRDFKGEEGATDGCGPQVLTDQARCVAVYAHWGDEAVGSASARQIICRGEDQGRGDRHRSRCRQVAL